MNLKKEIHPFFPFEQSRPSRTTWEVQKNWLLSVEDGMCWFLGCKCLCMINS